MIKNERGSISSIILKIILRLIITIIAVMLVSFATLKAFNFDVEIDKSSHSLKVINNNDRDNYNLPEIDDEYPNLADYQEDSYFYTQIDDTAKALYIGIQDNIENLKTGDYTIDFGTRFNKLLHEENGQTELSEAFQVAVDAISLDNPELFFIDFSKIYLNTYSLTSGDKTTYSVHIDKGSNSSFYIQGISSKDQINNILSQTDTIRQMIVQAIPANSTNFQKILYVHDWLIENLSYDETLGEANRSNIYGALIEKKVTCQGYAKAFKYIMDALSVPCVLVKGDATNSTGQTEKHMWDYVMINDGWYAVDATWDDPIVVGGGVASKDTKYKYFCKGKSILSNHFEEKVIEGTSKAFVYPTLIADEN